LSRLKIGEENADFATAIGSKKWKDRGDALDALSNILGVGKDGVVKCAKENGCY